MASNSSEKRQNLEYFQPDRLTGMAILCMKAADELRINILPYHWRPQSIWLTNLQLVTAPNDNLEA